MAAQRLTLQVPDGPVRGIALVLHGGRATSLEPARPWRLAAVRMRPFVRVLRSVEGLAVGFVHYRYRGWNGEAAHPVADAAEALNSVADRFPGAPVVLVGHSMGGRAALRVAGHPATTGVAALAPWLTDDDPVTQLAGRAVLIAHGDDDRVTDPARSLAYAEQARTVTERVCRFEVPGDGHGMVRRAGDWHRLVRQFVAGTVGVEPVDPVLTAGYAQQDLRIPLAAGGLPAVLRTD